jgi:aconitate hydratase
VISRFIISVGKVSVATTPQLTSKVYSKIRDNVSGFRRLVKRPLTLSEKILVGHLHKIQSVDEQRFRSGGDYVLLNPDRVALQDVTGQMAILEFVQSGLKRTRPPTTIHCDHLIQARVGGDSDTKASLYENNEVYQFLESACKKYGIGFWKPGAGIIHQVVLENYAFPGGLMIGTDSHTPNAGGLGMIAIGVGGARRSGSNVWYAMGIIVSQANRSFTYRRVERMGFA